MACVRRALSQRGSLARRLCRSPRSQSSIAGGPTTMALGVLLWIQSAAAPGTANAQSCHGPLRTSEASAERGASLGMNLTGAGFETPRYSGRYERVGIDAVWIRQPWEVDLAWAGYRMSKNGATDTGLGDLALGARFRLLSAARSRAGFGFTTTLPTGDRERELGMGHVMLTPSAWFESTYSRARVAGSLAYSRALGAASHHAHGGPIVEPMTASELAVDLRAGLVLGPALALEARTLLETPTTPEPTRALVGLGVQVPFAAGAGVVEWALPLRGTAFDWKLTSGLRFDF